MEDKKKTYQEDLQKTTNIFSVWETTHIILLARTATQMPKKSKKEQLRKLSMILVRDNLLKEMQKREKLKQWKAGRRVYTKYRRTRVQT